MKVTRLSSTGIAKPIIAQQDIAKQVMGKLAITPWMLAALTLLTLMTLTFAPTTWADDPDNTHTPEQFDYTMPLMVDSDWPVYELLLPLEVYRGVAQSDLADIRVYNADKQIVPHALFQQQVVKSNAPALRTLPYFPVYQSKPDASGKIQVTVRKDADGKLIQLKTQDATPATQKTVQYYLVDASTLKSQALQSLVLQWKKSDKGGLYPVELQGSNDLNQWSGLVQDSLSDISYNKQTILKQTLYTRGTQFRYYRLKFRAKPFELTTVKAQTLGPSLVKPVSARTTTVKGERLASSTSDYVEFRYDLGAFLPLQSIKVTLPSGNFFTRAQLWGITLAEEMQAANSSSLRRALWDGRLLSVSLNNEVTQLNSINLASHYRHYRYLVLRFNGAHTTSLKQAPELTLEWVPRRLVFLAQGKGPFTLVYGHPDINSSDFDFVGLQQVIEKQLGKRLHPKTIRHGTPKKQAVRKRVEEVRRDDEAGGWVLWAVLIIGVAVLGFMAIALKNQLGSSGDSKLD